MPDDGDLRGGGKVQSSAQRRWPTAEGTRSRYARETKDSDGVALELGVAVDTPESKQHERGHGVPGRRVIVEFLPACDETVPVAGVDEEAAALGIGEPLDEDGRKTPSLLEPAQLSRRPVELEQPVGNVRVVLEIGVDLRDAVAVRPQRPPEGSLSGPSRNSAARASSM